MGGSGVRRQRLRVGHPHAVHDHPRVMRLHEVEEEMQPTLGTQSPPADRGRRPLPAAQQAAAHKDRHERGDLHPHRRRRTRGQGVPSGTEQHAQHGEHRRAHAPHREGHTHDTRCCHAARRSFPSPMHTHHRPRTAWSIRPLQRVGGGGGSVPGHLGEIEASEAEQGARAHAVLPHAPYARRGRASAASAPGISRAVPAATGSGTGAPQPHVHGGGAA